MKNKIIKSILPIVFSIMILTIIGNSIYNTALAQSNSNNTSANQTGPPHQQERLQLQERQHQQDGNQTAGTSGGQHQQERLQLQERQHQQDGNQSSTPLE
jgi:biopolymer transport protein ExbB/TolQ